MQAFWEGHSLFAAEHAEATGLHFHCGAHAGIDAISAIFSTDALTLFVVFLGLLLVALLARYVPGAPRKSIP